MISASRSSEGTMENSYDAILDWTTRREAVVDCSVSDIFRMRATRSPRGPSEYLISPCLVLFIRVLRLTESINLSCAGLKMMASCSWINNLAGLSVSWDGSRPFRSSRYTRMRWIRMSRLPSPVSLSRGSSHSIWSRSSSARKLI